MKFPYAILAAALSALISCSEADTADLHDVAVRVTEKGLSKIDLGHYMGTCLYHGMADLALVSGQQEDMDRIMDILQRFADGKFKGPIFTNFIDYEIGGQATAMLAWKGQETLASATSRCAARMWREQPRTVTTGIMTGRSPYWAANDAYWIDIAFTVSPFFLYAGLLEDNMEYIDYAAYEALAMCRQLHDPATDLYHQGFRHPNSMPEREISEDNWSRGNGWMSMALGALLRDYPRDGQYREAIVAESLRFYSAICRFQDADGMWRQEMSNPDSYVETSGSAQLLAGLGAAIESGILDRKTYLPCFEKGLKGLLSYIDPDGSVGHTCMGNCVPGKGLKEDFEIRHWYYNENHSFGPAVLALAQAMRLGYRKVRLPHPLGWANEADRPVTHVAVSGGSVAWENDRIAFRVRSSSEGGAVGSGVEAWTKTVDYPVTDKWLDSPVEEDIGEGCDWYEPGPGRGVGGSGIWTEGRLVASPAHSSCSVSRDEAGRIEFTLTFGPYEAGGDTVTEVKRIEMVSETSFYKVTETLTTASGKDAVLAVGLQTFDDWTLRADPEQGKLYVFEKVHHSSPIGIGVNFRQPCLESEFGSAVLARPGDVAGIAESGNDRLMLLNVRSGASVTYYVGATFSYQQNSGHNLGSAGEWALDYENNAWAVQESLYTCLKRDQRRL